MYGIGYPTLWKMCQRWHITEATVANFYLVWTKYEKSNIEKPSEYMTYPETDVTVIIRPLL